MLSYQATLDFLFEKLPMFQRVGSKAYKKDLTNTVALCKAVGNPHHKLICIHVAGTNGKGSVSHMLASILQANGLKTGLYTSPHLKDFRERIRINGECISEKDVIDFVEKIKPEIHSIEPSFFEITVAMAFDFFANQKVDIAIIETGLGGRLDSTNVITPILSVITNISYDHMDLLGNTLPEIASEKAGIIKPNVPVVVGKFQSDLDQVFIKAANEKRCRIKFASNVFKAEVQKSELYSSEYLILRNLKPYISNLKVDLLGKYQNENICTVLAAVDELNNIGYNLEDDLMFEALSNVKTLTGLRGRWDILQPNPLVIADIAHNESGLQQVFEQINLIQTPNKILHIVFGMVKDKNPENILKLLPQNAVYYLAEAKIPRALPVEELHELFKKIGLIGICFNSVIEAKEAAINNASEDDIVLITGSTFIVAEAI